MSRYRAFAIHFAISFAIFVVLAWVLVYIWYPEFLFETDGGWAGMRIIVAVDLVLGPLLTLIVFKSGKPGLKFDLTAIGTLQLVCLVAGTLVVYTQRPVAIVYVDGIFFSMSKQDYVDVGAEAPELGLLSTPKWFMVDIPADPHEQSELRQAMFKLGRPLRAATERYLAFDPSALEEQDATRLDILEDLDRETRELSSWEETHADTASGFLFYPYGARYGFLHFAFERDTRQFVGVLPVNAQV